MLFRWKRSGASVYKPVAEGVRFPSTPVTRTWATRLDVVGRVEHRDAANVQVALRRQHHAVDTLAPGGIAGEVHPLQPLAALLLTGERDQRETYGHGHQNLWKTPTRGRRLGPASVSEAVDEAGDHRRASSGTSRACTQGEGATGSVAKESEDLGSGWFQ